MESTEIQISKEVESAALRDFYQGLSSGSYYKVIDSAKTLGERYERLLAAYMMLSKMFMHFHGIKRIDDHILIVSQFEAKIIEVSDH